MSDRYYVSTDEAGVEHNALRQVSWVLPAPGVDAITAAGEFPLVLRRAATLLDDLEGVIYRAEPLDDVAESDGRLEVGRARLVAPVRWNEAVAAEFALKCAQHVLGDAGTVELPNGRTLAEVVADAEAALAAADPDAERRLGRLARVRAEHRLRREGGVVQDVALELLHEDDDAGQDAIDDPAWTTVASVVDAVLAAVEALRSFGAPRYVAEREDVVEENGEEAPPVETQIIVTPWGPITPGAQHQSAYFPAWAAARDAAARARDVARERDGSSGEDAERAYQGDLLEELIEA